MRCIGLLVVVLCVVLGAVAPASASSLVELDLTSLTQGTDSWGTFAPHATDDISWLDATALSIIGHGFNDTDSPYDRLPSRAKSVVRPVVWSLSRMSAGLAVDFVSNSPSIWVNYTLLSSSLAMYHMQASGVSGCDLWTLDTTNTTDAVPNWRWIGTHNNITYPHGSFALIAHDKVLSQQLRNYRLYLPLYNAPVSMKIGVVPGSILTRDLMPQLPPIVWYGTSICQGACASRPGLAYTNIISRALGREIYNFGFSGNGQMELEVIRFLLEVKAALFVIDCLPNMGAADVTARTEPLVHAIRAAQPKVPIVLAEGTPYGTAWLYPGTASGSAAKNLALQQAYARLVSSGVTGLTYVTADKLFGVDTVLNPTVDGTHPTDLGHHRMALFYSAFLPALL